MIWRRLFFIFVPVTAVITILLYDPVSVAIYKITEPNFIRPIKDEAKELIIRNDSFGEGAFGTKRRNGRLHTGVDIQAPSGAPVYAAKSGLAFCGNVPTGYGKYVVICHPDGYITMYAHLSDCIVKSGQKTRRGDLIGFVGKTGNAKSKHIQPHLHFEIKKNGEPQDPMKLVK